MAITNKTRDKYHSFRDHHVYMLFVKADVSTAYDAGVFSVGGGSHDHKHVVPVYISLYVLYSGKFLNVKFSNNR